MKRLFIAIPFEAESSFLQEWKLIKNDLTLDQIKWIPVQNLHITLKFIGESSDEQIPVLSEIIESTFSNYTPELIHWNKIGIFGSQYKPRVIWLGCKEEAILKCLYEKLKLNMEAAGFSYDRQNFVPHISLARLKKPADRDILQKITSKYTDYHFQTTTINQVVLMESILKPGGAEYSILHRTNFS